ncbi:MAG: hypothetical protein KGL53_13960 [Elusimicrobia bacterium]|nr:hypothetical protein [Elusimicrobiota bacterium]
MRAGTAALLAAALALPAAAQETAEPALVPVGGVMLFYDTQAPLSFVPPTRRELPKDAVDAGNVAGEACQQGLSIPLSLSLNPTSVSGAFGRGGFDEALERIRKAVPGLRGVYDVRIDMRVTSVLGVWRRLCVEVTARGFR